MCILIIMFLFVITYAKSYTKGFMYCLELGLGLMCKFLTHSNVCDRLDSLAHRIYMFRT